MILRRLRLPLLLLLALAAACPAPRPPAGPQVSAALAAELERAESRLAAQPRDPALRRDVGLLAFFAGDRARALRELGAVVVQDPDDARAAWGLALALDVGKDDRAVAAYVALAQLAARRPDDPWAAVAGVLALRWLDDRAVDEGDTQAAQAVVALAASGSPVLVAAALDTRRFRQRGETEGLKAWTDARGCVTEWREHDVAMPAPHVALLTGGQRPLAIGAGARGGESGATRPLPGVRVGRATAARCQTVVRPPRARPALVVLETFVESDAERELELELRVLDTDVLARVWWDGQLVLARDTAHRYLPDRARARVKIGAGTSRVAVELAALGGPFGVELVARDPATGARPAGLRWAADPTVRPAGKAAPKAEFRAAPAPQVPPTPRYLDRLLADVLLAERALEIGDSAAASEAVTRLRTAAPGFVPGLELEARVITEAPGQAASLARDDARRLRARALELDPGALRVRLGLAEQLLADEDVNGALDALGASANGAPAGGTAAHWRADLVRATALREKGLEAEAEAAVRRAIAARPDACEVRYEAVRQLAREGKQPELLAAARRLVDCDGWTAVLAAVAQDAGDHALVLAERTRLLARSPQDPGRHLDLGRAHLAAGDRAAARIAVTTALDLDPWSSNARLALADLLAADGDKHGARRLLSTGLDLDPAARELAAALAALGAGDDLAPWRIDGRKVIQAFEADEQKGKRPRYQAPGVLVLDRMVVLVHQDGARVSIVHQIVKVLEKEGVEKWGEIRVPEGAELLAARTIKADGSVREPQSLGGKEGLTAPDLAVGDYVEIEYYMIASAPTAWDGGFIGDRFSFESFDEPFDRTEYVVAAPAGYDLRWEIRGAAPKPTFERFDGWEVTTFQKRGSTQLVPEPSGPPPVEWVASVLPYANVSLAGWRAWVGEQVYGARRADRAVRALALELGAGKDPAQTARAIHDFTLDAIDDGGTLSDEPASILSRRAGRRVILMLALCEAAGIRAELWLARPRSDGVGTPPEVEIPELGYPLVRLRLPGGDLFVDPRYRYAPLGYLPPHLRDVPMLLVPDPEAGPLPALKLFLTPRGDEHTDERVTQLDVKLAADGSATIDAVETLTGLPAAQWRDYLKDVPADEVERDLEQRALGFWFPGATLESLAIEAREDPYRPLVLRYRFRAPRYARLGGKGELAVPVSPMPQLYQRRYVLTGARTTTLVLDSDGVVRSIVKLQLPPGFAPLRALPAEVALSSPAGAARFGASITAAGGVLTSSVTSAVEPLARVPAQEYPAFVRFAGAADAVEQGVVLVGKK